MKFEKAFKINNKELSKFNEGKCGEFIFTDEAGPEFKSFLSMVKKSGINDRHQIESLGTENYHKYSMLSTFVHTFRNYSLALQAGITLISHLI